MAVRRESHAMHALYEDRTHGGAKHIDFVWLDQLSKPNGRYRLFLGNYVVLELDRAIPIRPLRATVFGEDFNSKARATLSPYIGEHVFAMIDAHADEEILVIASGLEYENRVAIATLQASSARTPQNLQAACMSMLKAQSPLDKPAPQQ